MAKLKLLASDFDENLYDIKELHHNRRAALLIFILLISIIFWMANWRLDVASHSEGEVVPATQVKPVQHLEGGIVNRIFISEGSEVKAGQVLVEMQKVSSNSDLLLMQSQIINLKIKVARLASQLAKDEVLKISPDLKLQHSESVQKAQEILESYRKRISTLFETQKFKISQQESQLVELNARLASYKNQLKIVNQQIQINQKLMESGLDNKYEELNLRKEQQELLGGIQQVKANINTVNQVLEQEKSQFNNLQASETQELKLQLEESTNELAEMQEQVLKYQDRNARSTVTAPIDGIVLKMNVFTEGGVVNPGGVILNIVPIDDPLVIETKLEVGDVGLVNVGQKVLLSLVSSTARNFSTIEGEVTYISADKVTNQDGIPYYVVRIKPLDLEFKRNGTSFPLLPGVRIQASILVGYRTVFEYIFSPFLSSTYTAFTET